MQNPARWRFGPFEVDAEEAQLRRDGTAVPVTRKALSLLVALLGRPGKLFTKAELFETVWAGTVVSDAALSRAIRELRVVQAVESKGHAFGEPADSGDRDRKGCAGAVDAARCIGNQLEVGVGGAAGRLMLTSHSSAVRSSVTPGVGGTIVTPAR